MAAHSPNALVAALEVYEGSVRSLSWKEELYSPPHPAIDGRAWFRQDASERYIDQQGWSFLHTHPVEAEPGERGMIVTTASRVYFGDGSFSVRWGNDGNGGMLTTADSFFAIGPSLWRLMGRCYDRSEPLLARPLSVQLRASPALEYVGPSSAEPWPGLRARGGMNQGWLDVLVRLDPQHGFAPRSVRLTRQRDMVDVEIEATLRYVQRGGTWIPSVGIMGLNYTTSLEAGKPLLSPERAQDVDAARSMAGLPEEIRSKDLADWIAALTKVEELGGSPRSGAGPLTCFGEELLSPVVIVATDIEVNGFMSTDRMFKAIPPEARMYDGIAGHRTDVEAVRIRLNALAKR